MVSNIQGMLKAVFPVDAVVQPLMLPAQPRRQLLARGRRLLAVPVVLQQAVRLRAKRAMVAHAPLHAPLRRCCSQLPEPIAPGFASSLVRSHVHAAISLPLFSSWQRRSSCVAPYRRGPQWARHSWGGAIRRLRAWGRGPLLEAPSWLMSHMPCEWSLVLDASPRQRGANPQTMTSPGACHHRSSSKAAANGLSPGGRGGRRLGSNLRRWHPPAILSGLQKGPAERGHVKKRQKVSKSFSTLFDNFRAGQKTSKIVKKCQKVFRHFSTIFARHHFSGPFWGALKFIHVLLEFLQHLPNGRERFLCELIVDMACRHGRQIISCGNSAHAETRRNDGALASRLAASFPRSVAFADQFEAGFTPTQRWRSRSGGALAPSVVQGVECLRGGWEEPSMDQYQCRGKLLKNFQHHWSIRISQGKGMDQ